MCPKWYKSPRCHVRVRAATQDFEEEIQPSKPAPYTSWKISTMRQSLISIILATALLFESYGLSVALPMGKTEDGSLEQEALLLSDEATENGLVDADLVTRTRGSKLIIMAADPNLLRDLRVLHSGLSLYKRGADADNGQVTEHRDVGQDLNIPILRRDTMRCMVGRVYRPCWEV